MPDNQKNDQNKNRQNQGKPNNNNKNPNQQKPGIGGDRTGSTNPNANRSKDTTR